MKDYYAILGISNTATEAEIKKAYKALALKYHPDRNPDNKEAEDKFKEINEAYSVVGDPQKRADYDNPVQKGFSFTGFDDFINFEDFFRPQPRQNVIEQVVSISLQEAFTGCTKTAHITHNEACETCQGLGHDKKSAVTCKGCNGKRMQEMRVGNMIYRSTCPICQGQGTSYSKKCTSCNGRASTSKQKSLKIKIPAGVMSGNTLQVAITNNTTMFVHIQVERDPAFEVDANRNLIYTQKVSYPEIMLGCTKVIDTIDNKKIEVSIDPRHPLNTPLVVKGEGYPVLSTPNRGNLIVNLVVDIPSSITEKAEELLKELSKELG